MPWAWFGAPLTPTGFSGSWNFSTSCRTGLLFWKAKQRRNCNVHGMCSSQTRCQRLEDFHGIPSRRLASNSHSHAEGQHRGYNFNFLSFGSFQTNALCGLVSLISPGRGYLTNFSSLQELPLGVHLRYSLNNLPQAAYLTTWGDKSYQSSWGQGRRENLG